MRQKEDDAFASLCEILRVAQVFVTRRLSYSGRDTVGAHSRAPGGHHKRRDVRERRLERPYTFEPLSDQVPTSRMT